MSENDINPFWYKRLYKPKTKMSNLKEHLIVFLYWSFIFGTMYVVYGFEIAVILGIICIITQQTIKG